MGDFLTSLGVVLALCISTYGWGYFIVRSAYGNSRQPAAFSAAVGCAVYILIGGILNVTQWVSPATINVLVIGGVCLALISTVVSTRPIAQEKSSENSLCTWIILIATGYYALTLVPTPVFNWYDDFHTYLVYPFRMLQTGTGSVGADDLLGSGTLTAQSFLHSILLANLPVDFVGAFDLLFCFLISGLLIDAIGKRTGLNWRYRLIPLVSFIVIPSQYQNISSLYSASMMALGLVYASMLAVESEPGSARELILRLLPVALFASAIAVLKLTFFGFIVTYALLFVMCLPLLGWRRKQVLGAGVTLFILTLLFAAPWILLYLSNYADLVAQAAGKIFNSAAPTSVSQGPGRSPLNLLSLSRLPLGGSYIGYMLIFMMIGIASVILIRRIIAEPKDTRDPNWIVGVCVFLAVLFSVLLLSYQVSPRLVIRYSCPILIALLPLTVSLLGSPNSLTMSSGGTLRIPLVSGMLLAGQVLIIGQFADVFAGSLRKAYDHRTIFALPIKQVDYAFSRSLLTSRAHDGFRRAQSAVPENEPLFAWVPAPFLLDFARNRVIALDWPGLKVLAGRFDFDTGRQGFEAYLRANGIRYLMLGRTNLSTKNKDTLQTALGTSWDVASRRSLILIDAAEWMIENRTKLFDNGQIVVIDIGKNP